jgi:hypothetical protein
VSAATAPSIEVNGTYVQGYSNTLISIINIYLVPALLAVAFIVFLWGVFKQFIWKGDSGEAHTEGSKFVASGLIGFVIILSLWALVNIARVTLGVNNSATNHPEIPKF